MKENSITEFIAEHYWGYSQVGTDKTNEYEVRHPKWEYYDIKEYQLDIDFTVNYGERFSILATQQPSSVMLLEGSEVSVENKRTIT